MLFDEIEKAHPDIFNILLQALDDGSLTDSQGRRVSFRNTIMIMTSNLGAGESAYKSVGFAADSANERDQDRMLSALKAAFRPEFLNRVDEIVTFKRLGKEEAQRITSLLLAEIQARVARLGVSLSFSPDAISLVASEGFDPIYGARPLRRAAIRLIEDPLAEELLTGRIREGDSVEAQAVNHAIEFHKY